MGNISPITPVEEEKESPNAPEITQNPACLSTPIQDLISKHLLTSLSPLNKKENVHQPNNPNISVNTTSESSTESPLEQNIYLEQTDQQIDLEPIKTMAGSLQKDIRSIYKFKDFLGGGHFGSVRTAFRRLEPSPKRLYAIKSISKQNLSKKDIEELTKEVDIISSLDHPNIINFYETYHDQFYFHIVMEYCNGKDLGERIKKDWSFNEKKIAVIIMKVLHAISYCHLKGITHRDLKPENIIYETTDANEEIKIIDFGLSRKYINNEKMHTILGTPYFVAPEVLKGSYDETCDIWSIGAMTYMMLCGEPPFKGKSNKEIFNNILTKGISFEHKRFANVSKEAKDFISKCLNKDVRPSAQQCLSHAWFCNLFTRMHSSLYISKEILVNIKTYYPVPRLKKIVMKYFTNMMGHRMLKPFKLAFYAIDFEHSGTIERKELRKAFEMGGMTITDEELNRIICASIENPNKTSMSYSDFIISCVDRSFITVEKLRTAFDYFDIDGSGVIDVDDVKAAMLRYGRRVINEDDVVKMVKEVTKNDSKCINFNEFVNMFKVCLDKNQQCK